MEDYGLYALIAGVVSMLSFFTNSLVSSTQRFLSISQGRGDLERLREVFGNSLLLHIFLGLLVAILLEALTPFLFHGFLNIPVGREDAAIIIYQQVILMVYISFIAALYLFYRRTLPGFVGFSREYCLYLDYRRVRWRFESCIRFVIAFHTVG